MSKSKVQIITVRPSCTCTVADLTQSAIQPRETAALELMFDSRDDRGRKYTTCDVLFVGDDEKIRGITLRLVATIEPDIERSHESVVFSRSEMCGACFVDVVLSPGRMEAFEVLNTECTSPAFSSEVLPHLGASSRHDVRVVRVTFDPTRWLAYSRRVHLLIATNSENEPIMRLPLIAASTGPTVSPDG